MYDVVYTKSLDNAEDAVTEVVTVSSKENAVSLFNDKLRGLLDDILTNEFLKSKISVFNHVAVITIESTRCTLAIVKK